MSIESPVRKDRRLSPFGKPPRFCSQDGLPLEDRHKSRGSGFDPFTGEPRVSRHHITRECPTPGHDVWVLVGEFWVQP